MPMARDFDDVFVVENVGRFKSQRRGKDSGSAGKKSSQCRNWTRKKRADAIGFEGELLVERE